MRSRTVTSRNIARSGADRDILWTNKKGYSTLLARQASQPQTGEADETPPNRMDRQKGLS
jgi:hypothetical protein